MYLRVHKKRSGNFGEKNKGDRIYNYDDQNAALIYNKN